MELNLSNETSSNETRIIETDAEATTHPLVSLMILFVLPFGVLLVVVPSLTVIIIILKNRKLKEIHNNIFYVNLLIADVLTILARWIITTTIIICYLLDLPNINCNIALMPLYTTLFGARLMFVPVVVDRFLYVALTFSYKNIVTTKRVTWTIASLWLLAMAFGIFSVVSQDHNLIPERGMCIAKDDNNPLFVVIVMGTLVISIGIITGTSIYLRYKIIQSNRFFQSVKRTVAEKQKALKAGRLVEILQEQVKPTFSVFIAGGIDGVFNALLIIMFILEQEFYSSPYIIDFIAIPTFFCQRFSHAVVYAMRDNDIRKEIYKKIRGPKRSKVIMLNGQ